MLGVSLESYCTEQLKGLSLFVRSRGPFAHSGTVEGSQDLCPKVPGLSPGHVAVPVVTRPVPVLACHQALHLSVMS